MDSVSNLESNFGLIWDVFVSVKPLSVKLLTPYKPLSAGRTYELECQVTGARPEPLITWWKGSTKMTDTRETVSCFTY